MAVPDNTDFNLSSESWWDPCTQWRVCDWKTPLCRCCLQAPECSRSRRRSVSKSELIQKLPSLPYLCTPLSISGATLSQTKRLYQGLFLAPTIVGESIKGSMLLAEVFGGRFGMPCNPPPGSFRTDIIQALQVGSKERILQFCRQVCLHVHRIQGHGYDLLLEVICLSFTLYWSIGSTV